MFYMSGSQIGKRKRGANRFTKSQKGKGKFGRVVRLTGNQRGHLRVGGYYGRFAHASNGHELKFHDVNLDDAVISATGTVTPSVNLIAQGVTESERVGRRCTIKSIFWRWECNLPAVDAQALPDNGDVVRFIMYVDKQANGAAAAVTDILESADHLSFNNLSNSGRFRTLYDYNMVMNYDTLASDGAGVVSSAFRTYRGKFYKKCNIPLEFDASTGAITEIRSNNIAVLLISRSGKAVFVSKIRLRFNDGG